MRKEALAVGACLVLLVPLGGALGEETAEKLARLAEWKGQQVTLLGRRPLWCTPEEYTARYFEKEGDPKSELDAKTYAGKTGSIVDVRSAKRGVEIVIELRESNERIVTWTESGLGFDTELEAAKPWVGRSMWSRGAHTIAPPGAECLREQDREGRIPLRNLEHVTITAAEIGRAEQPVFFRVRTDDGKEGWLDGWDGVARLDPRWRVLTYNEPATFETTFHLEDPRKGREDWGDAVWKLVEGGSVAIGMTEEQASLTCGARMIATGYVLERPGGLTMAFSGAAGKSLAGNLAEEGEEISTIYQCYGHAKQFLVTAGKVTKYVE